MIRFLLIIVGLIIGLAVAVVAEGRMAHLRKYLPEFEPAWTEAVTDASGVLRGGIEPAPRLGVPVSLEVAWKFDTVTAKGPVWRISMTGTGVQGQGDLTFLAPPGQAQLAAGRGELSLEQLPGLAADFDLGGTIFIDNLSAGLEMPGGDLDSVNAQLRWAGARIDGQAIGDGEMQVVSGGNRGWRAPFVLEGDLVRASGTLEGRFGLGVAQLQVTIDDAGAMPEEWKRALSRHVSRGADGWTFQREVDMSGTWPLF